jgi:hypothetical protein
MTEVSSSGAIADHHTTGDFISPQDSKRGYDDAWWR